MRNIAIPCSLYRGGTSRGVLFLESDLSYPREIRDRILLRIFGSPDSRQIDGLGGATSLTSKALVVGPANRPDADVNMTFAQVGVNAPVVDWGGNCGNMTTAVGVFAIEVGLVEPTEPTTLVRIFSVNTGLKVHAHVPIREGQVLTEGDYIIPGVPRPGARIDLDWLQPGGSATGRVLPTGQSIDRIDLSDGREVNISIVDAANPVAFCEAGALGLKGTELPQDIESRRDVCWVLEDIRSTAAEMIGIVPERKVATATSPGLPKVAFVAPAQAYRTSEGRQVSMEEHDLQGRLMSMHTAHRSFGGAAAICTAVASRINGTVVHRCRKGGSDDPELVRIAHPSGVMDARVKMTGSDKEPHVESARIGRTGRRIMSGVAYVPASLVDG
jgi:2-methylaconitate cis-trans-isomerase PrpF